MTLIDIGTLTTFQAKWLVLHIDIEHEQGVTVTLLQVRGLN